MLVVNFFVPKGTISPDQAAKRLGVEVFEAEGTIGDKLALSSSVGVYGKKAKDIVRVRCKEGFTFGEEFVSLVHQCLGLEVDNATAT